MNFLRRMWAFVRSGFGFRRGGKGAQGRYDGATWSPTRSLIHEALQSARFDVDQSTRQELQRRCRHFEKNDPIVQRLVSVFETYTAGCGLQISPNSSDPAWNARAKIWWDDWCKYCDLNTRQNFGTVQSLWARRWFIDGEIFVVLTRGGDKGRPRIQNIEAHLVRTPEEEKENPYVLDGVRIDLAGRPTHYFVGEEVERGKIKFGPPITADFVHHIFEPERTSQIRGIPFLASVINELIDLEDLHLLTIQKAKDAAAITNVVYNEAGEIPPDLLNRQRLSAGVKLNTGASTTEQRSLFYQSQLGGRTVALERGDKLDQHRSTEPGVVTMDYWRYKTELVCAGVDIPYCLVFGGDLQGTIYRGMLDTAASFFRARSMVIAAASQRVYEYVMGWATRNVRELSDPPADWMRTTISTPRAPNVDVGRNSAAMINELKHAATNFDLIFGPLGRDWRVEMDKFEEQLAYAQTKPNLSKLLQSAFMPEPAAPPGSPEDPEDDPDEGTPVPIKRKQAA